MESPASSVSQSPTDEMIEAIKRFRDAARRQSQDAQDAAREALSADKRKLEEARKFVTETKIGPALCRVWDEIKPWPAWSKGDDWQRYNKFEVTEVDGAETREKLTSVNTVTFRHDNCLFGFRCEENSGSFVDSDYKMLRLFVDYNGNRVFGLEVREHYDPSGPMGYRWLEPGDVLALRPGDWVATLVAWEEKIEADYRAWLAEFDAKNVRTRASKIDMG